MARWTLVDGYNLVKVLGAVETRADALERGRESLLRRLRGLPASPAERITVVFDGRSGLGRGTSERWGPIEVRFATGEGRADALILALLRAERDRSRVTVVTSDRELASEARRLGARVVSSQKFAGTLDERRAAAGGTPSAATPRSRARKAAPRSTPGAPAEKPPPPGPGEVARWEAEFSRREPHDHEEADGDRRKSRDDRRRRPPTRNRGRGNG